MLTLVKLYLWREVWSLDEHLVLVVHHGTPWYGGILVPVKGSTILIAAEFPCEQTWIEARYHLSKAALFAQNT